jgi:cytochrome c biogenesis protein CcmG, thiol:disulfide interchange protein DsbE
MEQSAEVTIPSRKPRVSWGRLAAWGGLLALLIILGVALLRTQQGQPRPGQKAPAFTLTTFDGSEVTLASLKGKVVLLNFWASWCVTCKDEAAFLEQAWQQYRSRSDVVFLGVAWTDTDSKAKDYIARYNISYPNGPDLRTRISQIYRITGVPETYIMNRDGVLVDVHLMPFVSKQEIISIIDPLLTP